LLITTCKFTGNTIGNPGGGGAISVATGQPIIANCLFSGNIAFDGGGGAIVNLDESWSAPAAPFITNCTFHGNVSRETPGGAIFNYENAAPTIINSIFWGNISSDGTQIKGGVPIVSYSDIDQDGYEGIDGNIRQDPLFVDPDNGNFHLSENSPCKDAGKDAGVYVDMDGDARPHDNGFDIGADEYVAEGQFVDVPSTYWAFDSIYKILNAGITTGCSAEPFKYCPYGTVTRAQMAVFLGRGIHGSSFTPPPATGIFDDVPLSYWASAWIEQFYNDGITGGCGTNPLQYCPDGNVTRAQMAIFLLRSKHDKDYKPPKATGIFDDVPVSYWAADWIEQLYNEGITGGCGNNPLRYCPSDPVTRAQMAVFMVRTFFDTSKAQFNPVTGHWYQLNDMRMQWDDAKAFAEYLGGYLATITTAAEGQWLYDAFGSALSIDSGRRTFGGNDLANEGQWQWVTGETWSYTNWWTGEPNDYGGNEDCVAFNSNLRPGHGHYWNDVPADVEYRSLIEYNSDPN